MRDITVRPEPSSRTHDTTILVVDSHLPPTEAPRRLRNEDVGVPISNENGALLVELLLLVSEVTVEALITLFAVL